MAKRGTCFILALFLGACCDPAPIAATNSGMVQSETVSEARKQGMHLLVQVADRYNSVVALSCQITTTTRVTYSDRPEFATQGTASVSFDRAASLKVQGQTPGGPVPSHSYEIVSDLHGARTRIAVEGADEWREHASIEDALVALSGVTKRAPVMLCGFLLAVQWNGRTRNFPDGTIASGMMSTVVMKEDALFNESMCHVLQARCAALDVVIYVRKADMMLAGCTESIGSDHGDDFVQGSRYPMVRMSMTHKYSDVRLKLR